MLCICIFSIFLLLQWFTRLAYARFRPCHLLLPNPSQQCCRCRLGPASCPKGLVKTASSHPSRSELRAASGFLGPELPQQQQNLGAASSGRLGDLAATKSGSRQPPSNGERHRSSWWPLLAYAVQQQQVGFFGRTFGWRSHTVPLQSTWCVAAQVHALGALKGHGSRPLHRQWRACQLL